MDNIFSEIFSMIDKDEISTKEEFISFLSNLINHPTPVREACAYKLGDLYKDEFIDDCAIEIILASITDINPNISRCICSLIDGNKKLQKDIVLKIIAKINAILSAMPKNEIIQNNKNHAKNKILFSLYWLMEALYFCYQEKYNDEILKIINVTILFNDYTIREKTAKILTKINNPPDDLIKQIKQDGNFYVNFYAKNI